MESLPIGVPHAALYDLASVLSRDTSTGPVELVVVSQSAGVNLREFAAYYSLADRIFGRLSSKDLYQYSRMPGRQLKVAQFRSGSLETIFSTARESVDAQHLLVLWLFLKYLPHLIRGAVAGYRDYEEGRYARSQRLALDRRMKEKSLSRKNRAMLRQLLREERELASLSPERVRQLARLLDSLYGAEERQLPAALRFARTYVSEIRLRIGKRERVD